MTGIFMHTTHHHPHIIKRAHTEGRDTNRGVQKTWIWDGKQWGSSNWPARITTSHRRQCRGMVTAEVDTQRVSKVMHTGLVGVCAEHKAGRATPGELKLGPSAWELARMCLERRPPASRKPDA